MTAILESHSAADLVCPIMDAERNQVYTGIHEFTPDQDGQFTYDMHVIKEQCAVSFDEIAEILTGYNSGVIFSCDGVPVFQERMAKGASL